MTLDKLGLVMVKRKWVSQLHALKFESLESTQKHPREPKLDMRELVMHGKEEQGRRKLYIKK